ncbi:MAG: hypothetical protein KF805_15825 [Phycisphaeraceae bacterium]|nr:hypothetical protein [Phycisphaeraceae bacterium]
MNWTAMTHYFRTPIACVLFLGALTVGAGAMAPEPNPVPQRWQFDVRPGDLRFTKFETPDGQLRGYFFLTYRVVNNTREDLLLAPLFELTTENGDIVRSGRDVPHSVLKKIMAEVDNPLAEDQISILGTLLQGEENGREGVVVFSDVDISARDITIYATGFSGETAPYEVTDPKTGKVHRELLRKTLSLEYKLPGDVTGRVNEPLPLFEQRWVMR